MKIRILLLVTTLLCLLYPAAPAYALDSAHSSIILLPNDPGLLTRQADKLHMLIDLLPEDYRLGIGICGQEAMLAPEPLTLARRALLHAALQTAGGLAQGTERDLQQLASRAITLLPPGDLSGDNLLILVLPSAETPTDWSDQLAAISAIKGEAIVLSEQLSIALHPLVEQVAGRQLTLDSDSLTLLVQKMGLGSGVLSQAVVAQGATQQSFHLDAEVQSFVLMVAHVPPTAIKLISPSEQEVVFDQDSSQLRSLVTPGYTCLHVDQSQAVAAWGWSGDWQLTLPAQGEASLWLVDPVRISGEVQPDRAGRLVTAAIWRAGQRLGKAELGEAQVVLRDDLQQVLLSLNDIGLNGDEQAGDGVFSGLLPNFLHPLVGQATLEVEGYVYRSTTLAIPGAIPMNVAGGNNESLLFGALAILVGATGLGALARQKPQTWRLQHRSAAGYLKRLHCGPHALYAGSGKGCSVRFSAAAGKRHLRLKLDPNARLNLEVLQSEPVTMVNGEQVFLRRELQHGDVVNVGDDQVLVEQMAVLRAGRRRH